ncbi:MAG: carbohydrate kinase, thermoresistant glucokinase family [Thermoleophilia bacterium]|nr:carbohydrate kinase, thermoresistant glucokinase family [Thermoleophilia bacterium]
MTPAPPQTIVVMGASGAGKSTLSAALGAHLGWPVLDADELHEPEDVVLMEQGTALTDVQRMPWLARVAAWIDAEHAAGRSCVVACSALAHRHRDVLRRAHVTFVHLVADEALLDARVARRRTHFMPPELVASQLATLEPLAPDERAVTLDAAATVKAQLQELERFLALTGS